VIGEWAKSSVECGFLRSGYHLTATGSQAARQVRVVPEADLWTKMIDDIKSFTSVVWLGLYPRATLSAIRDTVG
jgi:hypothetical protein